MKTFIKEFICIIVFGIVFVFTLNCITKIFIPKWLTNDDNMHSFITRGFYSEKKNSLDVMFMGNSDTYRGVSPILLWDKYGITSYGYTSAGQRMWTGYYMLEEALQYQKPKVIFYNVDGVFSDSHSSRGNYRKVIDNMKLSLNKIKLIRDEAFDFGYSTELSMLFPITVYHSRYSSLTKEDFQYAFSDYHFAYKGLDMITKSVPYEGGEYMIKTTEEKDISEKALKYLDKFVKTCKDNDIILVLLEIPSPDSWTYEKHNSMLKYANNNDLDFLDLNINYKEIGIDYSSDTSDGGDHLNVFGAEKVTEYIGKYINENINLENHKNDKEISKIWNEDSIKYHNDKEIMINNE